MSSCLIMKRSAHPFTYIICDLTFITTTHSHDLFHPCCSVILVYYHKANLVFSTSKHDAFSNAIIWLLFHIDHLFTTVLMRCCYP